MVNYSNPRFEAVITDWPSGAKRTTATFGVESHPGRGERGTRITLDPRTRKPGAKKVLSYARKVRIVDGDDGRTYFIELTIYDSISVMMGTMQHQAESVSDTDPRYGEMRKLFEDQAS